MQAARKFEFSKLVAIHLDPAIITQVNLGTMK